MKGPIVLLDGYSLLYRAYHGLQAPMMAPDGTPTNAVHGFFMMLLKVIEEEHPSGMAVAFDMHAPTLRAQTYSEYKATRKPMPDDMRPQVTLVRELVAEMGLPVLELAGYEADDILGTVSARCETLGRPVTLVTGDRDSFQLVGPQTTVLYTKKGITETIHVTPDYIKETYGVEPKQLIDVKALMGDTSDNIPGVAGIGEKTALKLIAQYGTVEKVLDTAADEQKGKLKERLVDGRASAEMSKYLATIIRDVPIDFDVDAWNLDGISGAYKHFRELKLRQVSAQMEKIMGPVAESEKSDVDPTKSITVERVTDAVALKARCEELAKDAKWVSVSMDAEMTVATDKAALAMPMGGDLLSFGNTDREAWEAVMPLLLANCPKTVWNIKDIPTVAEDMPGEWLDVMLAAYVLNPQRKSFTAEALCADEGIGGFAVHPASVLHTLSEKYINDLKETDQLSLYRNVELPLAFVLRGMEQEGFCVEASTLQTLSIRYKAEIEKLVDEIAEMMGERINLNSPKQLGEALFERMQLPAPKKTQRGYSTSAEVLEELAENYPVCGKILEYRKYAKLVSTYIDALPPMQDSNGRVHSRFDQVATATGRISSAEPNLQNIPVRTEIGREIRGAFVAKPGCKLVDADYSQIELRVLAHISDDPTMIEAFREGQDIHTRTAAEVYGVSTDMVTPAMRSASKAVNFGIVYGISDFSLSKNIGVSRKEARSFIDRYFARYPGVKRYMEEAVQRANTEGYAETLMGRRRYIPELKSSNFNLRSFGERCAMNSPIQGTAADIIKLAMIRIADVLKQNGLKAKLILQVHDELIIETPDEEVETVSRLLQETMESVIELKVPLTAEVTIGGDWRACK